MNINHYLYENRNQPVRCRPSRDTQADFLPLVKPVTCKSGLTLSVQASASHYCSPRDNIGPWSEVEVGFPSQKVDALLPYAEDASNPCDTVYAYVPIEVVEYVIESNGGIA